MPTNPTQHRRVRRGQAREPEAPVPPDEGVRVALELLQADLYRMIDEVARAGRNDRRLLVSRFERAWQRFKEAALARPDEDCC